MQTEQALLLVQRHRLVIEEHIAAALRRLDGDAAPPLGDLARSRWELARLLRQYHLFKQVEIYDPLIRHDEPDRAMLAATLRTQCAEGWERYSRYAEHWSGRDIAAEWPTYRAAHRETATAIRHQFEQEERMIRQLLAGRQRTRNLGP